MNWKTKAAESIVQHEAPVTAVQPGSDLKARIEAHLASGNAGSSESFLRSLLNGFKRYGSLTEKQAAAAERCLAPRQVNEADAATAAKLAKIIPALAARDGDFASSLLEGFKKFGAFTDRQRPYAVKLANSVWLGEATHDQYPEQVAERVNAPAPAPVVEKFPNLCAVVNLDKFAQFTIGDLKLTLKNDGSVIWVKFTGTLFGVIDSGTHTFRPLVRGLGALERDQAMDLLRNVEANPLEYAKQSGILTGRCSCCGRPLTDPSSIAIGVGPRCLERF